MKNFLKSTAGWEMIFCLLAAISPALPWSYQLGYDIHAFQTGFPSQFMIPVTAFADWHGAAITVAGGVGFLFLVATGSLRPVPWWRTLGIAVVGLSIVVFSIIYSTRHWNHFPVKESGGLLAIASSVALLFAACLEVRLLIDRRSIASS